MTVANRRKLFIPALKDNSGTKKVSRDEIGSLLIDEFTRLFKVKEIKRCESFCEFIPFCMSKEENVSLEAIPIECEI